MPYLIDGHNVIAAMEGIDLDDPNDEAKLVLKLRAWTARINRKAVLVFDGGIPGGPSRTLSTPDVRVIFAARQHTIADRIIRERIRELPDAPNWTVVSSDREILDDAAAAGARTMTAQDFAEAIERPPDVEKEKPDTVSTEEINGWLAVFGEVEPEAASSASAEAWATGAAASPSAPPKPTAAPKRHRDPQGQPPRRHTVTIGEQMGLDIEVPPETETPGGKPEEISDREVEAWLQVFHDDPNSEIPPPNLPKPKPRQRPPKPREAVVRKTGDLSSDEVDAWLALFSEPASQATESNRAPASSEASPSSQNQPSGPSAKLAEHRDKYAPAEGQGKADLSEEDLELWHRLFGEES
ncbi:MAG: NYN domain-containing protein [Anaerolineae bacterium]|nr:NYN domain-containing protein [Anaerolineae bacterium]